jgi:hypothetical protein
MRAVLYMSITILYDYVARAEFRSRYLHMPNYAIRVELKGNPPAERYESLHALMATHGFGRTVTGVDKHGNSTEVDLPHATYYGSSDSDCLSVLDSISAAIRNEIQQAIVVFVVQAQTWATA